MALAVLVVDRHAALQQAAARRDRAAPRARPRTGLGLVEQEAAVAVGAGDQRVARLGGERQGRPISASARSSSLLERGSSSRLQDQHLAARQQARR
jgi:hypothetical protein